MDPLAFSVPPNDQPNVTQLDFHQSMSHFKTMFPSLDMELIETVLRSNQGAVDQTIDQLLQISSETQSNNLPSNPPAYSTSSQNNYDKNLNLNSTPVEKVHKTNLKQLDLLSQPPQQQQLIDFDTVDSQACASSTTKKQSKFNPPLVGELPSDFLRITPTAQDKLNNSMAANQNLTRQSSNDHQFSQQLLKKKMEENEKLRLSSSADKETVQYLEDERIAILLQNEEFISELRRNKDFMHSLNFDTMNNTTKVKGIDNLNYNNETYTGTDEQLKERIRKMGESTKNKFYQIAGLFSRRKGLPSRDNLLGDQHTQYNTLENDSDGEEYGNSVKKQVHK